MSNITETKVTLKATYNELNGLCSDFHYMAHELPQEDLADYIKNWGTQWSDPLSKISRNIHQLKEGNP